jgi:hypothetical protein
MIDFDHIVLNVCENIFSIAIKVTLTASKPEAAPIIARGIYSSNAIDVVTQDEGIFSDQQTSIGIRLRDFELPPDRGDLIEIVDVRHPAYGMRYWVGDSDLDGQGGAMLMLRTEYP